MSKRVLPDRVRRAIGHVLYRAREWTTKRELARWRKYVSTAGPDSVIKFSKYSVQINDGPNFYIVYKDVFVKRIYHFEAQRVDPFILDCGSNIGMSLLYYKQEYPQARIIGFEPDPVVFRYLQDNVRSNNLSETQLVQAAISGRTGSLAFHSDGKYASYLATEKSMKVPDGWTQCEVPCLRLRDYLTQPVDFLKINIEGAEWETIADSEDRLHMVREMVIEYHHLPGLQRTLHSILDVLHRQGFEYLINDFDSETNGGVHPPFKLMADSSYFLLIYAKRMV
jgi:FkbM family methyltransferase